MGADRDRDRQRLAARERALGEQAHVVRRHDVDAGEALLLDDEAVDAAVEAELGVARDHHARGDHRAAVIDRRHRDRQLVEVDVLADIGDFAGRRRFHVPRRDRPVDRRLELLLDLAIGLAAQRHGGALARADDPGHHRDVVADHVVEEERRARLVDQRRDMADVHGLMQVDELAVLAQTVEELAEVFLHRSRLRGGASGTDDVTDAQRRQPAQ